MKAETKSPFFLHLAILKDASEKQLHERVQAVVLDTSDKAAFEGHYDGDYAHLGAFPIEASATDRAGTAAVEMLQALLRLDADAGGAHVSGILDTAVTALVQAAVEYATTTIGADVKEAVERK